MQVLPGPARTLLDLGCGQGAFLKQFSGSNHARMIGVDRSRVALSLAATSLPSGSWVEADVRELPIRDASIDIVLCSLLVHHFDPADAVRLLSEAGRVARLGVIVSDLTRSRLAWVCTWLFTRLFSRSWVFQVDGPRSVRAAYTRKELQSLAARANLEGATVRAQFPFRMLLVWWKAA